MIFVKIHKSYRDIVAVCDSNLIGKRFEQGRFQLDVKESFFKGEKFSEKEIIKIMQDMLNEDAIFNIVGEASVNAGLKAGIISQKGIKKIQGVQFAMVLM